MKKKKTSYREPLSKKPAFWVWAVIIVSVVAFAPVLQSTFLNWDDLDYITTNPVVQADSINLKDIFSSHPLKTYVPLTLLSFAFEHMLFGFNPFYFHLDNLLLHLAIAGLIYLFLRKMRLSVRAAGIASVLFAVHPVHVEAVAWVSARKDVLYALFYVLALLNYCWYLDKRKPLHYWLAFLCGLLSMMAKSMALTLPFVFLLCDWMYQRKDIPRMLFDKLPHFIYILPLAYANYAPNTSVLTASPKLGEALLIFVWSVTFYIKAFLFPFHLTPLYQTPEPVEFLQPAYLSGVFIMVICLGIIAYFRKQPAVLFAFAFYLASIFFLLRFDRLYNLSVVADRYLYLPMLGFCFLVGMLVDKLWGWMEEHHHKVKMLLPIVLLSVGLLLLVKTNLLSRVWRDNLSLWNHVIHYNPTLSVAYLNRGAAYRDAKDDTKAIYDFKRSLTLLPSFGAHFNLANIYAGAQQNDLAVEHYTEAIRLDATQPLAFSNRGVVHTNLKNYPQAIKDFSKAIELNPKIFDAYYNRALCYSYLNNSEAAIADYTHVLWVRPDYGQAYTNRAVMYSRAKQFDRALDDYNYFLRSNPQSASTYIERSRVYADLKKFDLALKDAETAKQLGFSVDEKYLEEMKRLSSR